MRFIIWLLAFGIASHALGADSADKSFWKKLPECSGKGSESDACSKAIERKYLADSGGDVKRSGKKWYIRTVKKTVTLTSRCPDENPDMCIIYTYRGFDRKLDSHLFLTVYYEGGGYMLLNRQSGRKTFLEGYPVASPDGKHVLAASEDLEAEHNTNSVEILQAVPGGLRRVALFDVERRWGPYDAKWLDNRRLVVKKHCYDPDASDPPIVHCGTATIEQTGKKWKITE